VFYQHQEEEYGCLPAVGNPGFYGVPNPDNKKIRGCFVFVTSLSLLPSLRKTFVCGSYMSSQTYSRTSLTGKKARAVCEERATCERGNLDSLMDGFEKTPGVEHDRGLSAAWGGRGIKFAAKFLSTSMVVFL